MKKRRTVLETDSQSLIDNVCDADRRTKGHFNSRFWASQMKVSTRGKFIYADTWGGFPIYELRLVYLPEEKR